MDKFPKILGVVSLVAIGATLGALFVITNTENDAESDPTLGGEFRQEIEVSPHGENNDSLAVKLANIDAGRDAPATVVNDYHLLLLDVREQFSLNTDRQIADAIQTVYGLRKNWLQWSYWDSLDLIHRQVTADNDKTGVQFMVEKGNIAQVAEQILRYRQVMDAQSRRRALDSQQTQRIPTH